MAVVIKNSPIAKNIYQMSVKCSDNAKPGQFYMLRAWGDNPTFSRPLSISDMHNNRVVFVYEVKGKGTKIFASLKSGDKIDILGPRGNGYKLSAGKCVLIGGGVGTAPLVYLAKQLKSLGADITAYLGYKEDVILYDEINSSCARTVVNTGGYITDCIDDFNADNVYICGPEIMMKKAAELYKYTKANVYVSMERRMACGIGACLGCNIKTVSGNRKVCSDGPVFLSEDVIYE